MKNKPEFNLSSNTVNLLIGLAAIVLLVAGIGLAVFSTFFQADLYQTQQPDVASSIPTSGYGFVFVTVTPEPQLSMQNDQQIESPPTPTPEPTPGPYFADANELGQIMVLEYHRIGYPEMRYQRTPENFWADLERLYENDYYPVNFIDLVRGLEHVPAGKKPVVLTFDDSDISHFRVLDNNTVDPNSAVGILLNFHDQHPDWPLRATFFVLGDDTANHTKIFGQPKWVKGKLKYLIDLGMEVGSHTVTHVDLSMVTAEEIAWQLAISKHVIEALVPGYEVQTMAVPFGGFPWTLDFLRAGNWQDYGYTYMGNAAAWGGPTISPNDDGFEPFRIARIEVTDDWVNHWITHFEQNPEAYYSSDGDPKRLTYPKAEQEIAAGE